MMSLSNPINVLEYIAYHSWAALHSNSHSCTKRGPRGLENAIALSVVSARAFGVCRLDYQPPSSSPVKPRNHRATCVVSKVEMSSGLTYQGQLGEVAEGPLGRGQGGY
jgi:hypothetical protein